MKRDKGRRELKGLAIADFAKALRRRTCRICDEVKPEVRREIELAVRHKPDISQTILVEWLALNHGIRVNRATIIRHIRQHAR